jgi:uncharacterized DUF497 family protein
VEVEFDPAKDTANIRKHGISLRRASDLDTAGVVEDHRFGEPRFRAYGRIDDSAYCLAYAVRGDRIRAISLRRAHAKEMRRHAPQKDWTGI